MNNFAFESIEIGQSVSFKINITSDKMLLFEKMSGDINPLHTDLNFAIERGFLNKVAYGMLASSFYSTLVGVYLPGMNCLLNECGVKFVKPVYVGDTLDVIGEVYDKREGTRRVKIKGKMVNQNGETVNTADIVVGFTR